MIDLLTFRKALKHLYEKFNLHEYKTELLLVESQINGDLKRSDNINKFISSTLMVIINLNGKYNTPLYIR
jgi:hypothetical protein